MGSRYSVAIITVVVTLVVGFCGQASALRVIPGGQGETCALPTGGELTCFIWSTGYANATTQGTYEEGGIDSLSALPGLFRDVSLSFDHACALSTDHHVTCWSIGNDPDINVQRVPGTYLAVTAGQGHACALTFQHELACWGANYYGMLRAPAGRFVDVVAGEYHTCALTPTGRALCWGNAQNGQLRVPRGVRFTAIGAGRYHTCGLTTTNRITCWGRRLTLDEVAAYDQQWTVPGHYRGLASGKFGACGLQASGRVKCWGFPSPRGRYRRIDGGSSADAICGIPVAGAVLCWGRDGGRLIGPVPTSP